MTEPSKEAVEALAQRMWEGGKMNPDDQPWDAAPRATQTALCDEAAWLLEPVRQRWEQEVRERLEEWANRLAALGLPRDAEVARESLAELDDLFGEES